MDSLVATDWLYQITLTNQNSVSVFFRGASLFIQYRFLTNCQPTLPGVCLSEGDFAGSLWTFFLES